MSPIHFNVENIVTQGDGIGNREFWVKDVLG